MEGINNFGSSSKGKNVVAESSCTKFVQDMKCTNIPSALALPPRPTPTPLANYHKSRSIALEMAIEHELKHGRHRFDPDMNMQKLRRMVTNKLAAQRSRLNQAQYVLEMKTRAENLQEEISVLAPQVQSEKDMKTLLQLENDSLKRKLEIVSAKSKFNEMEIQLNKLEIDRLRGLLSSGRPQHVDQNWNPQTKEANENNGLKIVLTPLGLQLVSVTDEQPASASSSSPPSLVGNPQPNTEPFSVEMQGEDEFNIDQYLDFEALLDLDPCNASN